MTTIVKRIALLAVLAVVVVTARAQFGSYSHDLPFMGVELLSSQGGETYATNLAHRWVHSDLSTNVAFTNWDDRMNNYRLSVMAGFTMSNTADGVAFIEPSNNALSNGGAAGSFVPTGTNWALGLIFKRLYNNKNQVLIAQNTSSGDVAFDYESTASAWYSRPANIELFKEATNAAWIDVLLVQTNAPDTGTGTIFCFTNGVLAKSQGSQTFRRGQAIGFWWGPPNTYGFRGYIREIWIGTNNLDLAGAAHSMAADLHYTRTNLYGN